MTTYSMKIKGDLVHLKNGVPHAKWGVAIIDENTGTVHPSCSKAAEALGVSLPWLCGVAFGRKEPSEKLKVRAASVAEVIDQYLPRLREIIEVDPPRRAKKPAKPKPKDAVGLCYREAGDGRVEVKATSDVNWSIAIVGPGGRVFRSAQHAAVELGVSKSSIASMVKSDTDGWRPASVRQVRKAWPEAVLAFRAPEQPQAAAPQSFMAVTWPDGQVTVRAAVGSWSRHFATVSDVPADIMATARTYVLGGGA